MSGSPLHQFVEPFFAGEMRFERRVVRNHQ
jgi:hypothetical protein